MKVAAFDDTVQKDARPLEGVAVDLEESNTTTLRPQHTSSSAVMEPLGVVGICSRDAPIANQPTGGFTVARPGPDESHRNQNPSHTQAWSTGLFSCPNEEICWWSFWCPCLVFSRTSQSFGLAPSAGTCGAFGCLLFTEIMVILCAPPCICPVTLAFIGSVISFRSTFRTRIRTQLGIPGSCCTDCMEHTFCSTCALSQEANESRHQRHPYIDFCSGERIALSSEIDDPETPRPFLAFKDEVQLLSSFSKLVLGQSFAIFLMCCMLTRIQNIIVLILIFVQPFLYLYIVYWRSHRQDAVLDIVIKLFAIGFWWTTPVTCIIELILQGLFTLAFLPWLSLGEMASLSYGQSSSSTESSSSDSVDIRHLARKHLPLLLLLCFVFAFVVTSAVEETMKHFIVRCCQYTQAPRNQYTILIYMMAGALGFSTAENIGAVFGYSSKLLPGASSFVNELFGLGLRVLLPIHVICAGIQAINTSKRDLEARNVKIWHILLPAILLHGMFDFSAMALGIFRFSYDLTGTVYDILSIVLSFFVALSGAIYLIVNYNKQKERIMVGWQRLEDTDFF